MKHVILGTAGHIDHGKTALIKALTGIDTDRLKEEKERGISIDLGFAELQLSEDLRIGVVDVPGHERFIKNMLAGAGGIDAVLFVVAADEGVMPQTREHLDIVHLLGVEGGVVALTKRDLVDEEWLGMVEHEVRSLLATTCLAEAPMVAVSSTKRTGLDELRRTLEAICAGLRARPEDGPARLPVDRVFTVEGFGTVVTGTLWSGAVAVGDRLALLPGPDRVARVRNVQVHGRSVERARAGQRTALALHGIDKEEIERGQTLVTPDHFRVTHMVDARLDAVRGLGRPLTNRQRVRFHLGASEVLARLVLLEEDKVPPGGSALVELRLEEPVVARRGDRFVLRSYSPMTTIAGGTVIDLPERKTRRFRAEALKSLHAKESGSAGDLAAEHLRAAGWRGLSGAELEKRASLEPGAGESALDALAKEGRALRVEAGSWYDRGVVEDLGERVVRTAEEFQRRNPLRWGIGKEELRSRLPRDAGEKLLVWLLDSLSAGGRVRQRGSRVRVGSEEPVLAGPLRQAADALRQTMREAGMSPPLVAELERGWRRPEADLRELLDYLAEREELTKVAPDVYYHTETLADARLRVVGHLERSGEVEVGDVKTLLGVSRKYAVPLLEFFDREGTTRRVGDKRVRGTRPV